MGDFVDMHCHILPGLDDGPPDLDSAVALVQGLIQLGFGEFHPTPHQTAGRWTPTEPQREAAAASLRAALDARDEMARAATIAKPAGENMWDELFLARQADRSFPTYHGGRAFLLEFPRRNCPPHLPQRLFEMRMAGYLPVIAHVERYPELTADSAIIEQLRGKAALLVNLSSLGGLGSWGSRRAARRLVTNDQIDAVASDAHGTPDLEACANGLAWLDRTVGTAETRRLMAEAPRRILTGGVSQ